MTNFQTSPIRQLANITVGGTPSTTIPMYWGGDIPWMASGDVHLKRVKGVSGRITLDGLKASNATLVTPASIAIALAGQGKTRGTAALIEIELCTNQSIALIKTDENQLLPGYLFHLLDSQYENLRAASAGGGRAGLSKGILENYEISYPPVDEQKAITTILDTIDEAIAAAEAQLAKQEKIKQGLIQDLLTRGIDETGQIRPHWEDRPELYKKTEMGFIPNDWTANTLGYLIDSLDSGISVNSNDRIKGPHEMGILKTSCLTGGLFRPIEHKAVLQNEVSRLSTSVKGDSLIISRMNTPLLVGESAYVEKDIDDIFLPDRLWITRMKENPETCVKWLSYVLRSPKVRDLISNLATGTSGSMKNIAKGSLLGITLAIPKPNEQQQISNIIDANSNQSELIRIELKKLSAIKTGLMQDLLTGQRRVTPELIRQVEILTGSA